nr:immunoglobulin heavy chain junction region [Mus musculus]
CASYDDSYDWYFDVW